MTKLFFIIGIRRSGTSILRTMISRHPEINGVEFEPHPLWAAIDILHFNRFKSDKLYSPYYSICNEIVKRFNRFGEKQWYGAKFALNPGTKALEWVWLKKRWPEAKFIFIVRNLNNTLNSFAKQDKDSVRGMINHGSWMDQASSLIGDFHRECKKSHNSALITFESLLKNPDIELNKVWDLLGIDKIDGFKFMVRKPEFK
jgi:hypothetical protein